MDRLHLLLSRAELLSYENAWCLTLGGASFVLNKHEWALGMAKRRMEMGSNSGNEQLVEEAALHMVRCRYI